MFQKAERPNRTPEEYKRKLAMKPRPRSKDEWDAIFQFYPTEVDGYALVVCSHSHRGSSSFRFPFSTLHFLHSNSALHPSN